MKRTGAARRQLIVQLVPPGRAVIDVGADHGHNAHAVGAIATERMPHRVGRGDVPWVICDGLAAFRTVDVAIITGMGAHLIHRIVAAGPRPNTIVVHCTDAPTTLRRLLASDGWRIDAEGLAPEGRSYAEVIRAVRGVEPNHGLLLEYGPVLLRSADPHLVEHLQHLVKVLRANANLAHGHDDDREKDLLQRASFLDDRLRAARLHAADTSKCL